MMLPSPWSFPISVDVSRLPISAFRFQDDRVFLSYVGSEFDFLLRAEVSLWGVLIGSVPPSS